MKSFDRVFVASMSWATRNPRWSWMIVGFFVGTFSSGFSAFLDGFVWAVAFRGGYDIFREFRGRFMGSEGS